MSQGGDPKPSEENMEEWGAVQHLQALEEDAQGRLQCLADCDRAILKALRKDVETMARDCMFYRKQMAEAQLERRRLLATINTLQDEIVALRHSKGALETDFQEQRSENEALRNRWEQQRSDLNALRCEMQKLVLESDRQRMQLQHYVREGRPLPIREKPSEERLGGPELMSFDSRKDAQQSIDRTAASSGDIGGFHPLPLSPLPHVLARRDCSVTTPPPARFSGLSSNDRLRVASAREDPFLSPILPNR
jgi:chromosome segregation ATPase